MKNALSRVRVFVAVIGLLFVPHIVRAEWFGGRDKVFTVTAVNEKDRVITVAGSQTLIHAWTKSIRRERPTGGSVAASLSDLRSGVRIRAFGKYSSSPLGLVASKILIQPQ